MLKLLLAQLCLVYAVAAKQNDDTLVPGTSGADVTEKVVSKIQSACIFEDDKLFLRRLGYVESYDGKHPDTYRDGYFGGIWQLDQNMFDVTQSSGATDYYEDQDYLDNIKTSFNIKWEDVKWEDLLKPMYSGLGSRLYFDYKGRNDDKGIPRDIDGQADYWKKYYRTGGDVEHFKTAANQLEEGCNKTTGVDMVFVLDGSGSIGESNFRKIKDFVMDVVKAFDIGPKMTQIGLIKYSTVVNTEFNLNRHSTKNDVLDAVDNIRYEAGGTNTHLALEELVDRAFTSSNGARNKDTIPRVGIVVTDGKSNEPEDTILAALKAHDADIIMFAVGIGSKLDMNELTAIASEPTCLHLILLDDFDEVEALKAAILKGTCDAPVIIEPGNGTTGEGKLPPGYDQNCQIKVPKEGATVKISAMTGAVNYYIAKDTFPSDAYYEDMISAVAGHTAAMFMAQPPTADQAGLIYCKIKGKNDSESNITIGVKPGDDRHCKSLPCRNNGTCEELPDSYLCYCPKDFTGKNCQTPIDPCSSTPCKNGATCEKESSTTYSCKCRPGYTGALCESEINECGSNPCEHGTCRDGDGGYTCECEAGWTGNNCDNEIDECQSKPCANGGTCQDGKNSWSCQCPDGYTGKRCETELDPCSSQPCNNGQCTSRGGNYYCICAKGWTGKNCGKPIDECASDPCLHGECKSIHDGYECCCEEGWTGKFCDENIDECASDPCVHGKCKDGVDKYLCECVPGYTGAHCDEDIDECESNPCVHGECEDQIDGYKCVCKPGWTGVNCDEDIDECASNPCVNGKCIDGENKWTCECSPGWAGTICDEDIDECASSPCVHGTCDDHVNGYKCNCKPGYTGKHCGQDIDECESNPCIHGKCRDKVNGYKCKCLPGYEGVHCETEIDECASNPCIHGTCRDRINRYRCVCEEGYRGPNCEIDIDECASGPCLHGKCEDHVNGYTCHCKDGWTGIHCDCPEDPCQPSPCMNGVCKAGKNNTYTCDCNVDWTGKHCESKIDACSSGPCKNGATCIARSEDEFECVCKEPYEGNLCEQEKGTTTKQPTTTRATTTKATTTKAPTTTSKAPTTTEATTDATTAEPDICNPNPCENGGSCVPQGEDDFLCKCTSQYEGNLCEQEKAGTTTKSPTTTTKAPATTTNSATTTKAPSHETYNCDDRMPCTKENIDAGKFYFPADDPTQFVQCSEWGQCFIMDCAPGTEWNPEAVTCDWPKKGARRQAEERRKKELEDLIEQIEHVARELDKQDDCVDC